MENKHSTEDANVVKGIDEGKDSGSSYLKVYGDNVFAETDRLHERRKHLGKAARKFKRQNSSRSSSPYFVNQMTRAERTDFRHSGKIPARLFMRTERSNLIQVNRYPLPENFSRRGWSGPSCDGAYASDAREIERLRLDKAIERAWNRRRAGKLMAFLNGGYRISPAIFPLRGQLT